ncbi:FtsX-like permease family protein [Catenulispora subtropica]|uniref:ABC transporter permease n=1 Tax=Catenulispora subtropica TaxID=450798 RepID=A0ABP5EPH7_9ACTN
MLVHRTVTAAAALTVLLASLTFAVLGATAAAVSDVGTRTALAAAPAGSTALVFTAGPDGDVTAASPKIDAAARRLLRPYPVRVSHAVVAPKLDLTGPAGDVSVAAASADDYARHIRLLSGTLLTAPGDILVPDTLARQAGLTGPNGVGTVTMTKALWGSSHTETHRIVGVYQASDSDPVFWGALRPNGPSAATSPLVFVTPDVLSAREGLASLAQMVWFAQPDLSTATASGLSAAVGRILTVENGDVNKAVFHAAKPPVTSLALASGLPQQSRRTHAAETAGMSGFLIVATLLAVLAVFALALTLRLVREHRAEEARLVQARGAHPRMLVAIAAGEALLLAGPALVLTTLVTGPLARGLRHLPGLHALPAPHGPGLIGFEVSLLVAAFCIVVQAAAAYRASRERIATDRTRSARVAAFQRAGIDGGLVALAVVGYLQLRHYKSPVTAAAGSSGAAGVATSIDPVLVLAPAATAAALAALALRLLPPAARLVDHRLDETRRFAGALGGWQVSRRAARHAGTVLLLVLALAVGAMTVTETAMRGRSAQDRATFQVGADARLSGSPLAEEYRRSAYTRVPGVAAVTPVATGDLLIGSRQASLVGIDSGAAPGVLDLRSDLAPVSETDLFKPLAASNPATDPAIAIPGTPGALSFDLAVSVKGDGATFLRDAALSFLLRDRDGTLLTIPVAVPEHPDQPRHESITLTSPVTGLAPAFPLRFEGLGISDVVSPDTADVTLTISSLAAFTVPDDQPWHLAAASDPNSSLPPPDDCTGSLAQIAATSPALCDSPAGGPGTLTLHFASGHVSNVQAGTPTSYEIRPGTKPLTPQFAAGPHVPAVVTDGFLRDAAATVGDKIPAILADGTHITLDLTGRLAAFPGLAPDAAAAVVDRVTLTRILAAHDAEPQWSVQWLATLSAPRTAAAYFSTHAELGTLVSRTTVAAALHDGAFQASEAALLVISAATAPVFATVGFAVSAAATLRTRRREFAVLRAIGARPRQLSAALWLEQAALALVAVAAGVGIGVATALLTVPLVTVDDTGAPVYPTVAAVAPWLRGAGVATATAAAVVLVVMLAARALSRVDLARMLRAGDEL